MNRMNRMKMELERQHELIHQNDALEAKLLEPLASIGRAREDAIERLEGDRPFDEHSKVHAANIFGYTLAVIARRASPKSNAEERNISEGPTSSAISRSGQMFRRLRQLLHSIAPRLFPKPSMCSEMDATGIQQGQADQDASGCTKQSRPNLKVNSSVQG